MEAHFPPAKLARFSDSSTGMMMGGGGSGSGSGSGHVGLDLGLGPRMMSHGSKSGFTFLQLQELEHQALIFKYMAAGIPVPSHLVLPIWKSLAGSSAVSGMCPSFLGFRGVSFDYNNSMEPEPGRCRRTDGKKWRCSKDVVPDQKYCERHMHRGRNRSRKHVEITSRTNISSSSFEKNNSSNESNNTNLSISIPLQLMTPNNTATTSMNTNYSGINASSSSSSSRIVGLSPKSVLQTGICKTESPL